MIKKKSNLIKEKLLLQASRVLRKIKPLNYKEITNSEEQIEMALYQRSISSQDKNEYGEDIFEWLDERLSRLTTSEMDILRKRYWEAKSYAIIANEMGHIGDRVWAYREVARIIKLLQQT